MKVKELYEGMLVIPNSGWEFFIPGWTGQDKMGNDVLVSGAAARYCYAWKPKSSIMLYVGTSRSNVAWQGTYTHHHFLLNGAGVIISGYDIRYLNAVENLSV